ncbi:hypothetical protein C8R43DRAFT_306737 [Mycena crocata]|nr:hypothetical protein C8R43DRAFT_306737 [Mycena crocata]
MFVSRILVLFSAIAIASASPAYAGSEAKDDVIAITASIDGLTAEVGVLNKACTALNDATPVPTIANVHLIALDVEKQVTACRGALDATPTLSDDQCNTIYAKLKTLEGPIGGTITTIQGKVTIITKVPLGKAILLADVKILDTGCGGFITALAMKCPKLKDQLAADGGNLHNAFLSCEKAYSGP